MRFAFISLAIIGWFVVQGAAHASTPANVGIVLPSFSERTIRWDDVEGADTYHLTGTFLATRSSASGVACAPPLVREQRTVEVDETLPAGTNEYVIELPALPPEDRWWLIESSAQIDAFDPKGVLLATGSSAVVAASIAGPCPTQTPPPVLPRTGSGSGRVHSQTLVLTALAGAFAAVGATLLDLEAYCP